MKGKELEKYIKISDPEYVKLYFKSINFTSPIPVVCEYLDKNYNKNWKNFFKWFDLVDKYYLRDYHVLYNPLSLIPYVKLVNDTENIKISKYIVPLLSYYSSIIKDAVAFANVIEDYLLLRRKMNKEDALIKLPKKSIISSLEKPYGYENFEKFKILKLTESDICWEDISLKTINVLCRNGFSFKKTEKVFLKFLYLFEERNLRLDTFIGKYSFNNIKKSYIKRIINSKNFLSTQNVKTIVSNFKEKLDKDDYIKIFEYASSLENPKTLLKWLKNKNIDNSKLRDIDILLMEVI